MTITVSNQKGGVGKTTLLYHLGFLFARLGKKTLLVDSDPQGNLTSCFRDDLPDQHNLRLLYEKGFPEPFEAEKNLSIIGTDITLSKFEADTKLENFFLLKNLVGEITHDVCLIDTPPSLGLFTSSSLLAAERVLVPIDISRFATLGLKDLIESIGKITRTTNSPVELLGIVLVNVDDRQNLFRETRDRLEKMYGEKLFRTMIPSSVRVREAVAAKEPVFDFLPGHKVSIALQTLFAEIQERLL
ncbi:MAG: ParA family protein [Candidatus Ratteibacteria bacterium]